MDAITFKYLMSLSASNNLDIYFMDVVTTYLYGSLDNDIYLYIYENPERIKSYKGIKYIKV